MLTRKHYQDAAPPAVNAPPVMTKTETKDAVKKSTFKLTPAEKRVLALVSLAKTNKEIAVVLGISLSTVKRHLENVLRKAHLKNRVEAAIYGLVVKGCPRASRRICLLKSWQKKRNERDPIWAI
jgi:DNA-binding CsgD family transcriptional regulator